MNRFDDLFFQDGTEESHNPSSLPDDGQIVRDSKLEKHRKQERHLKKQLKKYGVLNSPLAVQRNSPSSESRKRSPSDFLPRKSQVIVTRKKYQLEGLGVKELRKMKKIDFDESEKSAKNVPQMNRSQLSTAPASQGYSPEIQSADLITLNSKRPSQGSCPSKGKKLAKSRSSFQLCIPREDGVFNKVSKLGSSPYSPASNSKFCFSKMKKLAVHCFGSLNPLVFSRYHEEWSLFQLRKVLEDEISKLEEESREMKRKRIKKKKSSISGAENCDVEEEIKSLLDFKHFIFLSHNGQEIDEKAEQRYRISWFHPTIVIDTRNAYQSRKSAATRNQKRRKFKGLNSPSNALKTTLGGDTDPVQLYRKRMICDAIIQKPASERIRQRKEREFVISFLREYAPSYQNSKSEPNRGNPIISHEENIISKQRIKSNRMRSFYEQQREMLFINPTSMVSTGNLPQIYHMNATTSGHNAKTLPPLSSPILSPNGSNFSHHPHLVQWKKLTLAVTRIQCIARGFITRRVLQRQKDQRDAALMIQCACRSSLARYQVNQHKADIQRRSERKKHKAATIIQSKRRQNMSKAEFQRRKQDVSERLKKDKESQFRIHSLSREQSKSKASEIHQKEDNAALRIQRSIRKRHARLVRERKQEQKAAIIRIQSLQRKRQAIKRTVSLREKREGKAATVIQSSARGHTTRKSFQLRRKESIASVQIQSIVRKRQANQLVKQLKDEKDIATKSQYTARKSQAANVVSQLQEDEEAAAILIQSIARKRNAVKIVQQRREEQDAAVRIQAVCRRRIAEKDVAKMKEKSHAATKIQAVFRGKDDRAKVEKQKMEEMNSAVHIQRIYRGNIDRKKMLRTMCVEDKFVRNLYSKEKLEEEIEEEFGDIRKLGNSAQEGDENMELFSCYVYDDCGEILGAYSSTLNRFFTVDLINEKQRRTKLGKKTRSSQRNATDIPVYSLESLIEAYGQSGAGWLYLCTRNVEHGTLHLSFRISGLEYSNGEEYTQHDDCLEDDQERYLRTDSPEIMQLLFIEVIYEPFIDPLDEFDSESYEIDYEPLTYYMLTDYSIAVDHGLTLSFFCELLSSFISIDPKEFIPVLQFCLSSIYMSYYSLDSSSKSISSMTKMEREYATFMKKATANIFFGLGVGKSDSSNLHYGFGTTFNGEFFYLGHSGLVYLIPSVLGIEWGFFGKDENFESCALFQTKKERKSMCLQISKQFQTNKYKKISSSSKINSFTNRSPYRTMGDSEAEIRLVYPNKRYFMEDTKKEKKKSSFLTLRVSSPDSGYATKSNASSRKECRLTISFQSFASATEQSFDEGPDFIEFKFSSGGSKMRKDCLRIRQCQWTYSGNPDRKRANFNSLVKAEKENGRIELPQDFIGLLDIVEQPNGTSELRYYMPLEEHAADRFSSPTSIGSDIAAYSNEHTGETEYAVIHWMQYNGKIQAQVFDIEAQLNQWHTFTRKNWRKLAFERVEDMGILKKQVLCKVLLRQVRYKTHHLVIPDNSVQESPQGSTKKPSTSAVYRKTKGIRLGDVYATVSLAFMKDVVIVSAVTISKSTSYFEIPILYSQIIQLSNQGHIFTSSNLTPSSQTKILDHVVMSLEWRLIGNGEEGSKRRRRMSLSGIESRLHFVLSSNRLTL